MAGLEPTPAQRAVLLLLRLTALIFISSWIGLPRYGVSICAQRQATPRQATFRGHCTYVRTYVLDAALQQSRVRRGQHFSASRVA